MKRWFGVTTTANPYTTDVMLVEIHFIITIKVAIDFIQSNGLDYIIQVPKGSRAAAAVSVCLYYLAFNNDAMERLNQYPEYKLDRVVDYTLDLIETKPGFTLYFILADQILAYFWPLKNHKKA